MLRPPRKRRPAADSLSGLFAVVLTAALLLGFYFGREVLVPLALAALITFLLAPLVTRLARWIGNVASVLAAMSLLLAATCGLAWMVGTQAVDLADQLPGYKENIRAKLKTFQTNAPGGGTLERISEAMEDLKKDLPGQAKGEEKKAAPGEDPLAVKVVSNPDSGPMDTVQGLVSQAAGPLGTAAMVFLLATFMLLKREDLRARLLRLIGQGRISTTTRALDEAGTRVRKYLLMQLVINVTYGIPLSIGLYFIGVPNAVLWGALAAALRFIPYIGPWIAAAFPVMLSLAVSPGWQVPLMTMGLFVVLELISNNILEPWLYGASTGVSSIALIVSAVFWTWMWGTPGLVLSTPFTVCLVVMGRHIPQLSFFSVLMGEEEALSPADDCYQRLLRQGEHDEMELAEGFLRQRPLTALYDDMLVPVLIAAERDQRAGLIDREQRDQIAHALRDLVEELSDRPLPNEDGEAAPLDSVVRGVAARAERDEMAGSMAAHVLRQQGMDAEQMSGNRSVAEVVEKLVKEDPDIVYVSAVWPSKAAPAVALCRRIRAALPDVKIVAGLWGRDEDVQEEEATRLREAGVDEVFTRISDFLAYSVRMAGGLGENAVPPEIPEDETERLVSLDRLGLVNAEREPVLDHVTAKLAKVFDVPVAAITLVDRERQWFKAHTGLPEGLAEEGGTSRDVSICGHVVASGELMVVKDLKRDRRFSKNPVVVDNGLRFYAGAPIRMPDGHVIGALCLMDTSPRAMTPQERRLLRANAAEVAEEIERMAETEPA